ncbi:MAG: menaquinone biosynthesis protein [Armatimonadetes bacterium]|nr:menaquinone biosynthesis protein [Armatimonadota bacterium]
MKLGCLPYLNVKPLVYTLEQGGLPHGWELVYAPPSRLAEMLARGDIAAAPVSSFATFVNPELAICPGICIAADGPVKSVLLLSKKSLPNIDTIALDTSSLSGANMLRIILKESYGLEPNYFSLSSDSVASMLDRCDAAMVIGDPAMTCPKDGLVVLDIAEEWRKLTGLPAVFAVWAGKGITPELVDMLHEAKRQGTSQIAEIAREQAARLNLPYELCEEYLSRVMVYDLGDREAEGLAVFKQKAETHGLIARRVEVSAR